MINMPSCSDVSVVTLAFRIIQDISAIPFMNIEVLNDLSKFIHMLIVVFTSLRSYKEAIWLE